MRLKTSYRRVGQALALLVSGTLTSCAPEESKGVVLTFPVSAVGEERAVVERQLQRFMRAHPGIRVDSLVTPDAADERRRLYVQWLNAGVGDPDVVQLDVIWTPEFAAAGWLLPLDRFAPETSRYFTHVLEACRYEGWLYALPWFVDVGMLYWRTDLFEHPPRSLAELAQMAERARAQPSIDYGLVWTGARYEGLVTVFLAHLGAFGGALSDRSGRIAVDSEPAVRALSWMRRSIDVRSIVPAQVLTWREESVRFAFQNGQAAFMLNWPYAYGLLDDPTQSRVAGRFAVTTLPAAPGGKPTSVLGGQQLAVNANTEHPEAAWALIEFLLEPAQVRERAEVAGQLPPVREDYEEPGLRAISAVPLPQAREVIRHAVPRPTTPLYGELSALLQVHLHRALTGQATPREALASAAAAMRLREREVEQEAIAERPAPTGWLLVLSLLGLAALGLVALWLFRRKRSRTRDERAGWGFTLPALTVIVGVALFPLAWTFWESLHRHDLGRPWTGRPFVGLANYERLLASERFWAAMGHTAFFTTVSVLFEVIAGLSLALLLTHVARLRGVVRVTALLPWALPTVVAALVFRFAFDGEAGIANAVATRTGLLDHPVAWFAEASTAWVPLILADAWKTTPFVTLLLLAGLTTIDDDLYAAAEVDGARAAARFWHLTLPLLRPTLLVVLLFRTMDAFRVFDLVYVLTGGGPGTSTEPIALLTFDALLSDLRFGYGSALSVVVFLATALLAAIYLRLLGRGLTEAAR